MKAVIKAESDFNRLAVSPKGARGLMQLMPETAALHMVRDVFVPRDNIEGGWRHLRMLLDRYHGSVPLAVAAYNAGTRRVEEAGGIPPIPETREYHRQVSILLHQVSTRTGRVAGRREGGPLVSRRRAEQGRTSWHRGETVHVGGAGGVRRRVLHHEAFEPTGRAAV